MRIVMIGHSNAGKTTYMSLMYQSMRDGHRGFKIRTTARQQEVDLMTNAQGILDGRYPPPSSRRESYDFVLSHRSKDFFTFTWQDYRGGALSDRSTDSEVEQVLRDLRNADGIIVFADAQKLANDSGSHREVRRLVVLTQRALDGHGHRVPLVIAYTKADLVKDKRDRARAAEPLAALTAAARGSASVEDTSVWVACGRRPANVQVPVLWCLAHGVSTQIDDLEASVARHTARAEAEAGKATPWNSLAAWANGTTSHAKEAAQARERAQRDLDELKPLRTPARKLARALHRDHRG